MHSEDNTEVKQVDLALGSIHFQGKCRQAMDLKIGRLIENSHRDITLYPQSLLKSVASTVELTIRKDKNAKYLLFMHVTLQTSWRATNQGNGRLII